MDLIRQIFLNTNREYFVLHTDLTDHTDFFAYGDS